MNSIQINIKLKVNNNHDIVRIHQSATNKHTKLILSFSAYKFFTFKYL